MVKFCSPGISLGVEIGQAGTLAAEAGRRNPFTGFPCDGRRQGVLEEMSSPILAFSESSRGFGVGFETSLMQYLERGMLPVTAPVAAEINRPGKVASQKSAPD